MHYFVDLDGTLLDVSEKFYQTYYDILTMEHQPVLSKSLYWELKRNKASEELIRSLSSAQILNFGDKRRRIIETEAYQKLDTVHADVLPTLEYLKQRGTMVLVTLRHQHQYVLRQLKAYELDSYFDVILSAPGGDKPTWEVKVNLLTRHFEGQVPVKGVFIGDTEADILAGKTLHYYTVGVLNGMRNYEKMKSMGPNVILPSISRLPDENI